MNGKQNSKIPKIIRRIKDLDNNKSPLVDSKIVQLLGRLKKAARTEMNLVEPVIELFTCENEKILIHAEYTRATLSDREAIEKCIKCVRNNQSKNLKKISAHLLEQQINQSVETGFSPQSSSPKDPTPSPDKAPLSTNEKQPETPKIETSEHPIAQDPSLLLPQNSDKQTESNDFFRFFDQEQYKEKTNEFLESPDPARQAIGLHLLKKQDYQRYTTLLPKMKTDFGLFEKLEDETAL